MTKTILFGGSGFLGSYVADELTRRSYEVVIADIKSSPYLSDKQSFILCDIMDPVAIKKVVKKADVVFNFAGLADIDESIHHLCVGEGVHQVYGLIQSCDTGPYRPSNIYRKCHKTQKGKLLLCRRGDNN